MTQVQCGKDFVVALGRTLPHKAATGRINTSLVSETASNLRTRKRREHNKTRDYDTLHGSTADNGGKNYFSLKKKQIGSRSKRGNPKSITKISTSINFERQP